MALNWEPRGEFEEEADYCSEEYQNCLFKQNTLNLKNAGFIYINGELELNCDNL